jgi:hypothetical protein
MKNSGFNENRDFFLFLPFFLTFSGKIKYVQTRKSEKGRKEEKFRFFNECGFIR